MTFNVVYSKSDRKLLDDSQNLVDAHSEALLNELRDSDRTETQINHQFMADPKRCALITTHFDIVIRAIPIKIEFSEF
jgi:hypothetical protein